MPNNRLTAFPALPGCFVRADSSTASAPVAAPGTGRFASTPVLTEALRAGDENAFRWLHEHWQPRLARYCFALARGDEALATEIVQATYLRVLRHMRVLADDEALWSWLACAARSAAIDLGRMGGRYRQALARFAGWLGSRHEPADDSQTEGQLVTALDAALAQLTAEERELIADRYFQRVPLQATAERLHTSTRAIEGRLARVRQKLRQAITNELRRDRA